MEFIRTIRERQQTAKQQNIQKEAEAVIRVADFESTLYIAVNGTPLILIEDSWTPKDIVKKLSEIRDNYVRSHQSSRTVAMF